MAVKEPPSEKEDDEKDEESKIPGVAGTALAVVNSKPFTALLSPSFEVIGKFWGERTTEWVEGWNRKRKENLHEHRRKVEEKVPQASRELPTERQAVMTLEWTESAQTVDPERDADLSALWQGLLNGIYSNDRFVPALIDSLKQMSEPDARALLDMHNGWNPTTAEREDEYEKLRAIGLVKQFRWLSMSPLSKLISITFPIMMVLLAYITPEILYAFLKIDGLPAGYLQISFALMGMIPIAGAIHMVGAFRLTALGKALRESGLRFRNGSNP